MFHQNCPWRFSQATSNYIVKSALGTRKNKQGARHGGTAFVTDLAMGYFQNLPFLLGLRLRLTGSHTIAYIEI